MLRPHEIGAVADRHAERDDVGGDAGHAADKSVSADADELVHGRESADDGAFADRDMSAEVAPFTSVTLSPMLAVVGDVAADHQEAIGADLGRHVASLGARIDGDVLADQRVRTDGEGARLVVEFDVLGRGARATAKGNTLQPAPSVVRPVMLAWECTTTPSPSTTWGPITQNGPISTFVPSFAPGSTRAVA